MSSEQDLSTLINSMLSTVPLENPLNYLDSMYNTINPGMIEEAMKDAKKVLQKEHKKNHTNSKNCNVFLALGGDGINQMFFNGVIATLLWLPYYLNDVVEAFKLDRTDVEITKKVLNQIKLPKVFDAYDIKNSNGEKIKVEPSNCRHYAGFLIAITKWITTGITSCSVSGEMKSNMELVRLLSNMAINSFPSIPWCSYFIGSTKTTDAMALSEHLTNSFDFTKYMSGESYSINQPRFIVATNDAPLVGIAGHPLSKCIVGQTNDNKTEWIGAYVNNDEFERLCVDAGVKKNDVQYYVLGVNKEQHEHIKKDDKSPYYKIANFVESNHFLKAGFVQMHKFDENVVYIDNPEDMM